MAESKGEEENVMDRAPKENQIARREQRTKSDIDAEEDNTL